MKVYLLLCFESLSELEDFVRRLRLVSSCSCTSSGGLCARVLCDETLRKLGGLLVRIARDHGLKLEVFEVCSGISDRYCADGVTYLPVKDDLDVLKYARELGAILVTGDRKLAEGAKTLGIPVIFKPPSAAPSKEVYAIEVFEEIKKFLKR
ncbi:MAG: hypothetical protein DRJ40_02295 [Thermoprotei archaeon]|nr:MAG: hypothetical protein DRJ40_02295 [Thermoprotei archaeon]